MKLTRWMTTTFAGLFLIGVLASGAAAQDKPQEPAREVHLVTASMPRERQIELALSAAPTEVSSKASVYILGPKGYEKVREGTNGFSCLIERSFKGTTQTSSAPACFDAEGSGSIMLAYLRREELRGRGQGGHREGISGWPIQNTRSRFSLHDVERKLCLQQRIREKRIRASAPDVLRAE